MDTKLSQIVMIYLKIFRILPQSLMQFKFSKKKHGNDFPFTLLFIPLSSANICMKGTCCHSLRGEGDGRTPTPSIHMGVSWPAPQTPSNRPHSLQRGRWSLQRDPLRPEVSCQIGGNPAKPPPCNLLANQNVRTIRFHSCTSKPSGDDDLFLARLLLVNVFSKANILYSKMFPCFQASHARMHFQQGPERGFETPPSKYRYKYAYVHV